MTDRPCITALIEDLSKVPEDHEASALVRNYAQSLRDCGAVTSPRSAWPAIVSANTDDILSLLRAAYLDGVEYAKQRPVFATVADALPPVDHEAEARLDVTLAERRAAEVKHPLR